MLTGFLAVYVILYGMFRKPLYKRSLDMQEQRDFYHAKMLEQMHQATFAKIKGVKDFMALRLRDAFDTLKRVFFPYQHLSLLYGGLDQTIFYLAQTALFIVGGFHIVAGRLTIGLFTVLAGYFSSVMASSSFFFSVGAAYQQVRVSYGRMLEILLWERESTGCKITDSIVSIEAHSLSFSYGDKVIFRNLNFRLERGNMYLLLGENGAGKSTLLKAILGLFSGDYSGELSVNGLPLESYDIDVLRQRHMGFAEQEPILLHDSFMNNLVLGNTAIQPEALTEVVDLLDMTAFIDNLPHGIETIISKDSNLSGGEKQKIAIARILLADYDVMLFDEPTASLDIDTKITFINHLKNIERKKIIVIITHDSFVLEHCIRHITL